MSTPRKVLVTGGAGFIGSHVVDAYARAGSDVTVIDDLSSGKREHLPDSANLVVCDICSEEAKELIASGDFDVVNHHAAQMDVRVSVNDPGLDATINIMGLLNLLEGAREGGVERIVFASSGGVVYGESNDLPHPESAPKLPVSPYGVCKLTSEYYLCAYMHMYGLKAVSLRYSNVYGPRQNPHGEAGVVAIFGNQIRKGEAVTIYGDGSQTRDYVFVGDVARANLLASEWDPGAASSLDAAAFNIGTGVETSVTALADSMIEGSGKDIAVVHVPARTGELLRSAVDGAKAERELAWSPEISLEGGLRQTYSWVMEMAG